jgi:hypothetical protein
MTLDMSLVGEILFLALASLIILYVAVVGVFIVRVEWWRIKIATKWLEKKLEPLMMLGPFLIPFGVVAICEILGG